MSENCIKAREKELKPCPVCGSKAELCEQHLYDVYPYIALCSSCWVNTDEQPSMKHAIESWNNRPIEDAKAKRIEELEKQLDVANGDVFGFQALLKSKEKELKELKEGINNLLNKKGTSE